LGSAFSNYSMYFSLNTDTEAVTYLQLANELIHELSPYAVTVAAISFVMFIIAGFVQNAVICLAIGVALTIATLFVIKAVTNKAKA